MQDSILSAVAGVFTNNHVPVGLTLNETNRGGNRFSPPPCLPFRFFGGWGQGGSSAKSPSFARETVRRHIPSSLSQSLVLLAFFLLPLFAGAQNNPAKSAANKGSYVDVKKSDNSQTEHIQILGSDLYEFKRGPDGNEVKTLTGNVRLQDKNVLMFCDRADLSNNDNDLKAAGHVKIIQDTVQLTSDSLHYDAFKRKAVFTHNVTLTDKKMNLKTSRLDYNMATRVADYHTGGTLKNDSTTLVSRHGYYYANTDDVYFKKDIVLTSPKYNLTADTLRFNSNSRITYFLGPTNITSDSTKIYCEGGYYNTATNKALFKTNSRINYPHQYLRGDSIFYDKLATTGTAYSNVLWVDTTDNINMVSDYAHYNGKQHSLMGTNCPLLTLLVEKDSLYLAADTLKTTQDTVTSKNTFCAYHHVKIFKSNLQALCDSLTYKDIDSTFRLFKDPVVWMDKNQMKADTIQILMKNKHIDKINLLKAGFVSSKIDTITPLFNQMKGKNMYGYFENGEMKRLFVDGNGESVYFAKDDSGAYIGVNKIICSNMMIYLKKQQISRIAFNVKPQGTFYPVSQAPKPEIVLKNFIWLEDIKPKSKEDLQ